MYCRGGGDPTIDDQNTGLAVDRTTKSRSKIGGFNMTVDAIKCHLQAIFWKYRLLELSPLGMPIIVPLPRSHGGRLVTDWPDGKQHPEDWSGSAADPKEGCIQDGDGAFHVQNETSATGTAFAISHECDISKVTIENLAVSLSLSCELILLNEIQR